MRVIFNLVLVGAVLLSCNKAPEGVSAQEIIDKTIEASGGDNYLQAKVNFKFREHLYESKRLGGTYEYRRLLDRDSLVIEDVLTNQGFSRIANGQPTAVADSMAIKYSNSINSVLYFALLPYGLNDAAVIKERLEDVSIKQVPYYQILITFKQEGGGKDFEDQFLYWINKNTDRIDYLAYSYKTDGGGIRFREAFNQRNVNGIWFADYKNYKPVDPESTLASLPYLFTTSGLELLSQIVNEQVEVSLLTEDINTK